MSFSDNFWYTISSVVSNGSRSLHWCSENIVCNSDSLLTSVNASWQITTHGTQDNSAITYTLKNRGKGPDSVLSINLGAYNGVTETQPAMAPGEDKDTAQQWDLVRKGQLAGENIWFIQNIANGSNWNFAEQGEGLYMAAAAQTVGILAVNQTWIISKIGDINDASWSASPISSPTSQVTSPGNSTHDQVTSSHKLSGGTIAGIVLGTVLGIALIIAIVLLVFHIRRKRAKSAAVTRSAQAKRSTSDDGDASDLSQKQGYIPIHYELPTQQYAELPSRIHEANRSINVNRFHASRSPTPATATADPRSLRINTTQPTSRLV